MQDPEAQGFLQGFGSAPPAEFEDPQLRNLLEPIRKHKQVGADMFKKRDLDGALTAYQAAVAAAGGTKHGSLAWPQAEKLVFACRSNAALCLLELGRPEAAVAECDLALTMPCAEGSDLLVKVLVRKLQGLINVSTPRSEIHCYLDLLRKRGVFGGKAALLVEQVARLSSAETGSVTERAFDVLTEHWQATKVVTQGQLDAAKERIAAESERTRDAALVRELVALARGEANGKMGIVDLIRIVVSAFSDDDHAKGKPIDETCKLVRWALLHGGMQPPSASLVDPDGGGNLVWAVGASFENSRRTAEDIKVLQLLLGIIVDEAGADINQRGVQTRLPLMYAARSGCLLAVQSMLSKGANVHLRDQEGWSRLLCCCMNDVTDKGLTDRVACLQALLNAGADVNSQTLAGAGAMAASVAVPSEEALLELAKHAPLAEVGAGTGYWSSQLQQRGVDMVAYDSRPPSSELTNPFFYDVSFGHVLKGDGATLFVEKPELAIRTLVLIWPNNPDSEDHPEFAENHRETVWDADCLTTYMAAGGRKVIYVGERMSQIKVVPGAPPDSGITGSRRFQNLLEQHFTLEKEMSIPQWFLSADDLTVWIRK